MPIANSPEKQGGGCNLNEIKRAERANLRWHMTTVVGVCTRLIAERTVR
ncbi:hypothetical protein DSM19430T_15490 [Desulfovibrio psychrotolerans]|uniref:Uncharacterized protein n=1 Tax=Desulfovibrio psychrotolerans TaxID=415242 RepID=A0A7J0BUL9_9BACT|nr:hypothetical protein DSM19430T_15490 [Desulfovibrio psychrotolerans]